MLENPPSAKSSDRRASIRSEVEQLSNLKLGDLRHRWRLAFGKVAPKAFTRDLLIRTLAWRIQERAFGGHDRATARLLDNYARAKADEMPLSRRLKSGTVLVREYQGVRHTVTVMQEGFIWQEATYSSLSLVARKITGANWNGPRFFGLRVGTGKKGCREGVPE